MPTFTFHAYLTSPATEPPANTATFLQSLRLEAERARYMETPEDNPTWLYLGEVTIQAEFPPAALDRAVEWSMVRLDAAKAEILAEQHKKLQRIEELRANLLALPAPREV